MLSSFVHGMRKAGAEVTEFNLYDMDIQMCKGCMNCSSLTNGKCVLRDDMTRRIYPEFLQADLMVLATPIYFGNLNACMKNFIDRLFPFLNRFQYIEPDGSFKHSFRKEWPDVVVISSSSWQKEYAFGLLSAYMHYLFGDKLKAEFYRGTEAAFSHYIKYNEEKKRALKALHYSGKRFAQGLEILEEDIRTVTDDLGAPEDLVAFHNLCIDSSINARMNSNQWIVNGNQIMPGSPEHFLLFYRLSYHKEACKTPFSIQFDFNSGSLTGQYCMFVGYEELEMKEGLFEDYDVMVSCGFDVWMGVANHNIDSARAILDGQIKVSGNSDLIREMGTVFYLVES